MGVYFPNMKKPPSCSECPVKFDCGLYFDIPDGGVDSNCPVIYVNSPHGKLGDLDALRDCILSEEGHYGYLDVHDLRNVPTIIPAERKD